MPTTGRMGFIYSGENEEHWWDIWVAMMDQFDVSIYSAIENPNLFLTGGGEITLNTSTHVLTWTEDFELLNVLTGGVATIAAGSLSGFVDGKIAYIEVSRPLSGAVTKIFQLTDSLSADASKVFIAMRRGSSVYCRNHANRVGFGLVDKWDTKKIVTDSASSGGGTVVGSPIIGIDMGSMWRLRVNANGNTVDSTIQFFSDAGMTDELYLAANKDCYAAPYDDGGSWFVGMLTDGRIHYKITNDGANASTYDIEFVGIGRMV